MSEHQDAQNEQTAPELNEPVEAGLSADRRSILKKLGKFGIYTAPTMLAILEFTKAAHASPPHITPPRPSTLR